MMIFIVCRSCDYNPPPSKKQCITPSVQTFSISSTTDVQISRIELAQSKISHDILVDHAKILYLFQCFQEAKDNQLCKYLVEIIFKHGSISLRNQVLHPHHIASLGLLLSSSRHEWKLLDLTSCHLEDEGFDELHHYLQTNKSTIEQFDISNNNLTEASLPILTDFISQLQPSHLELSGNRIRFGGLKDVFSKASTVKVLYVEMIGIKMKDTTITMVDREVICNMMSSLTVLFIGDNRLYDEGAELLSEGLGKTSSLNRLNVHTSNICTKGGIALANALSKNTSLETLRLNLNDIGDDGAVAFANALMNGNRTLATLDIRDNNIGHRGTKALDNLATSKPSLSLHYSEQ